MSEGPFFWSLTEHRVVGEGEAKAEDRLGPYPTREAAEKALEHVAERNEAWDTDPKWNDPDEEDEQEA